MAKTKKESTGKTLKVEVKIPSYFKIGILFPDGKKIVKPRCTMNEIFETYFIGLDKYLKEDITGKDLFNKYQESFKNKDIKVSIQYVDSWGHLWRGKVAWPKEELFIEYLNKRLQND